MPTIYVNTDNSHPTSKLFNASKLGKSAAAAEKKMQQAVIDVLSKEADFNTDTPDKGYSLRMKVLTEPAGRGIRYTVTVEVIRYPLSATKGGKAEEIVPLSARPGSAIVERSSEATLLNEIVGLTKQNVTAALGVMKVDMTRR